MILRIITYNLNLRTISSKLVPTYGISEFSHPKKIFVILSQFLEIKLFNNELNA
jgi:hypothetical protein